MGDSFRFSLSTCQEKVGKAIPKKLAGDQISQDISAWVFSQILCISHFGWGTSMKLGPPTIHSHQPSTRSHGFCKSCLTFVQVTSLQSLHMFWWSVHFDHNCVLFFENIQRITHQTPFVSTHHEDQWGMAERYVKSFQIWQWRASNATDVMHSFFQAAWPPKNYSMVIWKGRQGKAFYSLQPFSCPFLVRPLVEACHFIASYNLMSFQYLSTYPLSDPNSWPENPLQDPPPPKRNQDGLLALAPRSVFGAGFGPEKRWDDLRVRWEELRWGETSWQELRSAE